MAVSTHHHVVLFPYLSKGHTIPLLQFGRLLLRHHRKEPTTSVTVTVFTTPKNQSFVSDFLSNTPEIKVVSIPFPENISGIPPGVENTEKLPSMSLFVPFTRATKLLQPFFEETLKNLPKVSFMVTDGFLWWTSESAAKFEIPRLVFFGMNSYASAVCGSVFQNKLFIEPEIESDTEPVTVPDFPWIRVKKCDFSSDALQAGPVESDSGKELFMDQMMSTATSHGILVNSFYELESAFVDYNNNSDSPKSWSVGPLCLIDPPKPRSAKPAWIHWLDRMQEEGRSVLYVAFGTQSEILNKQIKEIALGLEDSKVNFLWVTRKDVEEIIGQGFKDRTRETGIIVRDWVDQWEILSHESIKGFLSHCGWNSAQESICVGVPLLAWPMMAEQPLNAKMVVEEVKVGVRVETQDGRLQGFVTRDELSRKVNELMEGEMGKTVRKNVKEYSKMAKEALVQGTGSSWKNLDLLLTELCKSKEPSGANK